MSLRTRVYGYIRSVDDKWYPEYQDQCHIRMHPPRLPIRLGNSVIIACTFYDDDGDEKDPDAAPAITITDDDDAAEATAQTMTEDSEMDSTYYYSHDIATTDSAGGWKAVITAEMTLDETRQLKGVIYFPVSED